MGLDKVVTIGSKPTMPVSDFMRYQDIFGPPAGTYYVDGNVSASGDGSADYPYSTLAAAITASDAAIASASNRWWARRNRIYICGDTLTEDLVKFPTKCDVIGVGSYDANTRAGLYGHHVPVGEAFGTRFFNVHFRGKAAASPLITLGSSTGGIQFHGCGFDGTLGTMTIGIQATASPGLEVIDCDFFGTFVTSYITFGAGQVGRVRILRNRMLGTAAKGIVIPGTITASWIPVIDGNIIRATGLWIDDDSDAFVITNNRGITDVNTATFTDGFDFSQILAAGNIQTGSNGDCDTIPHELSA